MQIYKLDGQKKSPYDSKRKLPSAHERKRLARNARQAMRYWFKKRCRNRKLKKFIEKIKAGYPHWFTFVIIPGVEPTNNEAERALRELVVQRKIIGTLRNEKGIFIYETLPTLLATWKQRGLNPKEALSEALGKAWLAIEEQKTNKK